MTDTVVLPHSSCSARAWHLEVMQGCDLRTLAIGQPGTGKEQGIVWSATVRLSRDCSKKRARPAEEGAQASSCELRIVPAVGKDSKQYHDFVSTMRFDVDGREDSLSANSACFGQLVNLLRAVQEV